MYYLLEDNRIIKGERLSHWEEVGKDRNFIVFINGEFKSVGKIKAQSENVADFIEVGDLVKIKGNYDEYITQIIENPFWVADLVFFYGNQKVWFRDSQYDGDEQYKNCDLNNIIAIYKPNKNGDYICVWRREK